MLYANYETHTIYNIMSIESIYILYIGRMII